MVGSGGLSIWTIEAVVVSDVKSMTVVRDLLMLAIADVESMMRVVWFTV